MRRADRSAASRAALYAGVTALGLAAAAAGGALLAAPDVPDAPAPDRVAAPSAPAPVSAPTMAPAEPAEDEPGGPKPVPDIETGACSVAQSRLVWPGRPYCN